MEVKTLILNVFLFLQILNWWEVDDIKMLSRWAYMLYIEEYPESF